MQAHELDLLPAHIRAILAGQVIAVRPLSHAEENAQNAQIQAPQGEALPPAMQSLELPEIDCHELSIECIDTDHLSIALAGLDD